MYAVRALVQGGCNKKLLDTWQVRWIPRGSWVTGCVTNMSSMFKGDASDDPIGRWDTSGAVTMKEMFNGATLFNQPLVNWDTSSVTNMETMFNKASNFDQPIG